VAEDDAIAVDVGILHEPRLAAVRDGHDVKHGQQRNK
jgi:hypothetical protein